MRDMVLQGAGRQELEALSRIARDADYSPPVLLADRLRAKGWLDTVGGTPLITLTGRTLLDGVAAGRSST